MKEINEFQKNKKGFLCQFNKHYNKTQCGHPANEALPQVEFMSQMQGCNYKKQLSYLGSGA